MSSQLKNWAADCRLGISQPNISFIYIKLLEKFNCPPKVIAVPWLEDTPINCLINSFILSKPLNMKKGNTNKTIQYTIKRSISFHRLSRSNRTPNTIGYIFTANATARQINANSRFHFFSESYRLK